MTTSAPAAAMMARRNQALSGVVFQPPFGIAAISQEPEGSRTRCLDRMVGCDVLAAEEAGASCAGAVLAGDRDVDCQVVVQQAARRGRAVARR